MSTQSKIEWTDHTLNLWWGCMKVSSECKNCYAETLSNRWGYSLWGTNSKRKAIDWKKQLRAILREAKAKGVPQKVFCGSMMDIFEGNGRSVHVVDKNGFEHCLNDYRGEFFDYLVENNNFAGKIIWQFLTKRPENIVDYIPVEWNYNWPANVWLGASVGDIPTAGERMHYLYSLKSNLGANTFVSAEPMLADITHMTDDRYNYVSYLQDMASVDWIICGGESGTKVRPPHPEWVMRLKDFCAMHNIPFFFKQWGSVKANPNQLDPTIDKDHPQNAKGGCQLNGEVIQQFPPSMDTKLLINIL